MFSNFLVAVSREALGFHVIKNTYIMSRMTATPSAH